MVEYRRNEVAALDSLDGCMTPPLPRSPRIAHGGASDVAHVGTLVPSSEQVVDHALGEWL
jgi:hypothetical protein